MKVLVNVQLELDIHADKISAHSLNVIKQAAYETMNKHFIDGNRGCEDFFRQIDKFGGCRPPEALKEIHGFDVSVPTKPVVKA